MNGIRDHHVEWDKPSSKSQMSCFHSYAESRPKMIIVLVIIIIITGHKYKKTAWEKSVGRVEKRWGCWWWTGCKSIMHMHMKIAEWNPLNSVWKRETRKQGEGV
jgi:hypothetical protein